MLIQERPTPKVRAAVAYELLTEWIRKHHRLADVALRGRDAAMRLHTLLLRGEGRECPCCGGRFRSFRRARITSMNGICPRCHSFSRQRGLALLLERMDLRGRRILHFAPERALDQFFERMPGADRVTTDLIAPADLQLDITDTGLPDDSFDLVICSHVLEHVLDDGAALRELARITAPGGMALIVIPYRPHTGTFENPEITKPLDRTMAFGAPGHVRRYGSDFGERLRRAGFEPEDLVGADLFDLETLARCQLRAREHFFHCRVE